ncbi:Leucine efflux protein [compost metagenome]
MYGIENISAFIFAATIVVISPGVDTIMVLTRSISNGKIAGFYSVIGVCLGLMVHTCAATFGLSIILAKSAFIYSLVKYIGAAYLIYLGYKSFTAKTSQDDLPFSAKPIGNRMMFYTAFISDVLNPKIAIFFLAFLPQFINVAAVNSPMPYFLLGAIILSITFIWCSLLVILGSKATSFFNRSKKAESLMNKLSGIVFILLGLKVALTKR